MLFSAVKCCLVFPCVILTWFALSHVAMLYLCLVIILLCSAWFFPRLASPRLTSPRLALPRLASPFLLLLSVLSLFLLDFIALCCLIFSSFKFSSKISFIRRTEFEDDTPPPPDVSWSVPIVTGDVPSARGGHTATAYRGKRLIVFGGHCVRGEGLE